MEEVEKCEKAFGKMQTTIQSHKESIFHTHKGNNQSHDSSRAKISKIGRQRKKFRNKGVDGTMERDLIFTMSVVVEMDMMH